MSYHYDDTPVVHVGAPPSGFQYHWVSTKVIYHRFTEGNAGLQSPQFNLLNHQWFLKVSPQRGTSGSDEAAVFSIFLKHMNLSTIDVEFGVSIKDVNDKQVAGGVSSTIRNKFVGSTEAGWLEYVTIQKASSHLVKGSLVIELRMRHALAKMSPFIPDNPSECKTVQDLFMDMSTADIVFEIGDGKQAVGQERKKVKKTSAPTNFYGHKSIIQKISPQLAELCTSTDYPTLVHIQGVAPETFHQLLMYMYGFDIPTFGANFSDAKEVIEAADKYGVTNLKLEAEARYVGSLSITMENVMEHLVFADSKNCALLKEAVMDFVVKNKAEILKKKTLANAPEGLTNDMLAAMMRGEKESGGSANAVEYSSMRISELRNNAHAKGLDVDGSREMLITALEAASGVE